MNIGLIVGAIIFTFILTGIGGGAAYYIWIKTRKKKETWNAKIYQLGDGVKSQIKDKDGNLIKTIPLKDLKPYGKDVLEKIDKEPGITIYRLQKLNRTTQEVTSGFVDYWGKDDKEISILYHEGNLSLINKGYDERTAQFIFNPMPLSRINMMKSEMAIRKDRLVKDKDILQAISPWIVSGMALLALVALFYLGVQGMIQISDNLAEALEPFGDDISKTVEDKRSQIEEQRIQALGVVPTIDT